MAVLPTVILGVGDSVSVAMEGEGTSVPPVKLKPGQWCTLEGTAAEGPTEPPTTPPGPGCGEFTPKNFEIAWPTVVNVTPECPPGWTKDVAMVIHFKVPLDAVVGTQRSFQFTHTGPPYQNMVASVSNAPGCNVVRTQQAIPPAPPILMAAAGGFESSRFKVSGPTQPVRNHRGGARVRITDYRGMAQRVRCELYAILRRATPSENL
jgi:hypothetical protein